MPNTTPQITYAVSLHLSKEAEERISLAVKALADATGDSFIVKSRIPPHITLGAFHGTKEKEARLIQLVKDFSKEQKPCKILFTGVENFNKKVIFLKPQKDSFLAKMNLELHKILLKEFERAENGYYLPEIWVPHTALATRVNKAHFDQAVKIADQIKLPLESQAKEIALYQCHPILEELKRFTLG
ncbi:MAG: 2'-5' RNA ligase family protein [Treponema sp.]|nr:2'-5' RNA ligase family protein [Treponema sp.]